MKKYLQTAFTTACIVGALTAPAFAAATAADAANDKVETKAPVAKTTQGIEQKAAKTADATTSEEMTSVVEKEVGDVKGIRPTIGLGVEARFYAPHLDAKVSSDSIKYNNGEVGLKDTLGFDNDNAPEYILSWKRMSLDWIHVHGKGKKNLDGALTFDKKTYTGEVKAKSNFDYIKLDFKNPILSLPLVNLNWNYGISAIHWDGEVKGNLAGTGRRASASKSYWVPVPYLGVGTSLDLDPAKTFKVYANISGLPMGGFGHYYDLEAGLRFNPIDELAFTVGYRRIDINVHHDDDSGNITLNGPFAGLSYKF